MKVNIVTPVRPGGPYYGGKQLAKILNERGIYAIWTHKLLDVLLSPLIPKTDITHSLAIEMFVRFKPWKGPLVFSMRGDYQIERKLWQRFYSQTIRHADLVTSPSQYLKQKLGVDRAIVIPNGILPEEFNLVIHADKECLNLVTVTEFSFWHKAKGILDIAKILHAAQENGARFHYKVIGGGHHLTAIKEESRRYGIDIEFTGFVANPKQALEKSDIFLYYSYHDNFPMVILEAMATGLPIVTCHVGAMSEIIDNGINGYIAQSDQEFLSRFLTLSRDYELRQQIGHNAREKVEHNFNLHIIADTFISLYEEVLGRKSPN